jgi:hypothetical protein
MQQLHTCSAAAAHTTKAWGVPATYACACAATCTTELFLVTADILARHTALLPSVHVHAASAQQAPQISTRHSKTCLHSATAQDTAFIAADVAYDAHNLIVAISFIVAIS